MIDIKRTLRIWSQNTPMLFYRQMISFCVTIFFSNRNAVCFLEVGTIFKHDLDNFMIPNVILRTNRRAFS